ncbi:uncharacterized protein LOC127834150 [Dreissena polymorpha]|nr:uncharacterized protein LOC127834134 isoform X2 [Dreissena polymorpha]XP_052215746.1 uncharacterized protein LOC127834150 [Dreissena polymorpha]XP_052215754.1 uncharacterized protein LOC127834150 [Dreissena polymorpha]
MFRGKRLALCHVLLLTSYLYPSALSQSHSGFVPPIQTAHATSPFPSTVNTIHPQAINYPVAKGFSGYPYHNTLGDYSYYPVDGQYWTGQHVPLYSQYLQYPQQYYNPQPYFPPYGQAWATPYSYPNYQFGNYYTQQSYGYIHPQTGYSNSYGQYPAFHPQYWTGVPTYHQTPYNGQPAYYDPFLYPSHPMMYQGHYYAPYPALPYPGNRGILGGPGSGVTKGVIGGILAGLLVGTAARRG